MVVRQRSVYCTQEVLRIATRQANNTVYKRYLQIKIKCGNYFIFQLMDLIHRNSVSNTGQKLVYVRHWLFA